MRTVLAAVAASAVALVPTVMIGSPAYAAAGDNLTVANGGAWEGNGVTFKLTYTGTVAATFTLATADGASITPSQNAAGVGTLVSTAGDEDFKNDSWTVNGTAGATTVTFAPASASSPSTATVTVATADDDDLADEGFKLTATNTALNGGAGDGSSKTANGSIWAYGTTGAYPTYTLKAPSTAVAETATKSGSTTTQKTVTVTAELSNVLAHPVTIPVSTVDDSAMSSGGTNGEFRDYDALPATAAITIPAYSYTGTIDVTLWDDSLHEDATQTFDVAPGTSSSYGPQPAVSASAQTPEIKIKDDEPVPTVSIADAPAATETDYLQFPISLSGLSELPVAVTASTADGIVRSDSNAAEGAITDNDYTPNVGAAIVVSPYTWSRNFSVATTNKGGFEGPENVKAFISGTPTAATLGTPTAAYGIIDDAPEGPTVDLDTTGKAGDSLPSGTSFLEGSSGEVARKIGVDLGSGAPWPVPVKIDYAFTDGTATNGVDYRGTSGSIVIPANTTPGILEIPVTIIGDTIKEGVSSGGPAPDFETFNVVLSSTTGTIDATSTGGEFRITEAGDDLTASWSVGNATVVEGNTGTATAKVPVTLSAPADGDTTFSISLADGTATETGVNTGATAGANDYDWPASRILTIPAGSTTGTIDVPINSDAVYEQDETIVVTPTLTSTNISDTRVAGTLHASALTVTNDDAKPSITFNNISGNEGNLLRVNGKVTGVSQYEYKVGLQIAGSGLDPATAGTDFDAPDLSTVTITVPQGSTGALATLAPGDVPFDVYLTPDTMDEATETFTVTATETTAPLTGFTTSVGTFKITGHDAPPTTTPPATTKPTISAPAKIIGAVSVPITGTAGAGAAVELWGAPTSGGAMVKLLALTTGQNGNYSFSRWIGVGYKFQVRSGDLVSDTKTVQVQQVPVFVPTSTVAGTLSLVVLGNPRAVGQSVIVQRWVKGTWVNTWSGKTGSNNQYKLTVKAPSKSTWTLRAFVAGSTPAGLLPGYSASKTITIK